MKLNLIQCLARAWLPILLHHATFPLTLASARPRHVGI